MNRIFSQRLGQKPRPDYRHIAVGWLSVAIIIDGFLSLVMGIVALSVALENICSEDYYYDYRPVTLNCQYSHTYVSAGIWAGVLFIASGFVGILSARRKTTCFIISMMSMALVAAWIAVVAIVVSIWAQFDQVGGYNPMPTAMRIGNGFVSASGFVAFILSWVKFGFGCRAVCCNGLKGYPEMKERQYQYQQLPTQPMVYGQSELNVNGPVPCPVPVIQSMLSVPPVHPPQPVFLVQGNQVIGVLPQSPQQAFIANTAKTTTPGAEPAATVEA